MRYPRSLRARLSWMFFGLFATVVVLGAASAWSLHYSNAVATHVRDIWLPSVRLLGDLNNFTSDYRTAEADCLLAASGPELDSSLRAIPLLSQEVRRAQLGYEQIPHGKEEAALYQEFSRTWAAYESIAREVTTLAAAGRTAQAAEIYRHRSRSTYDAASDLLDKLTGFNVALADQSSKHSAAAYEDAKWLMGAALVLAGLTLTMVIAQVRRQVSLPLLDLGRAMHRLAANDTGVDIGYTARPDEIGEMARAVMVFRANAIDLMHSQRGLAQQATMLEEKLAHEQSVAQMQRNFVSVITHEFRTPLTQIDAQAQRLTNLKDRLAPQDIADRAGRIRTAVTRIVRMIDQLVDTTRLMDSDARLFFHPEPIELVDVLRDVCRVHREISREALITEHYGEPPLLIFGDPKLLFQAFSNLLSNAIKYSNTGAKVVLRAEQAGRHIVVSVEDSGIGIPEKDRAHIFSRYYRGSNVSGFVGTGIGLFLVAMVVRLHNGQITVDTAEGNGSRFTVTLPGRGGAGG
ncbi:MAG TPA: ATP-binding protein [Rhodopila sp.]|nr:ATP-binding protein [Rhodopila sp.]